MTRAARSPPRCGRRSSRSRRPTNASVANSCMSGCSRKCRRRSLSRGRAGNSKGRGSPTACDRGRALRSGQPAGETPLITEGRRRMSYIDDHLLSGEQVRHRASLHWATLIGPSLVLGVAILSMLGGSGSAGGVLALLGAIWFGARWLARSSSEFGVTNKRVLIKVGVVSRRSVETLLSKVEGIGVD